MMSLLTILLFSASPNVALAQKAEPRVVYPEKTELDFEGTRIDGELKNPAEFYFQNRPQTKFDSLVKRRPNFHHQMLRDVVNTR
jgi:hypothetical protein